MIFKNAMRFLQFFILGILIFYVVNIKAVCNVCQTNQAACINSSSFYLCFGESTPNMERLYHCKEGFDCTNLDAICVQTSSQRQPSCGDTSQCGLCSAQRNFLFACQSRSTFQMCYGAARPTGQLGFCPLGYVCDATTDAICVPNTLAATITCDLSDELVATSTTTQAPTTTSTIAPTSPTQPSTSPNNPTSSPTPTPSGGGTTAPPMTPIEVCESVRQVGLFPTMPNDPYCKRYIYCYSSRGMMRAIESTCATGSYYNIEREVCTINKPSYCI